jgi:hypothetical protein
LLAPVIRAIVIAISLTVISEAARAGETRRAWD